jgi:hypothetical protein
MKKLLATMFVALLMVGCKTTELAKINLDDPETLKGIIAGAIGFKKLQERGQKGEEIQYAKNQQTPYTGWAKALYDNGQILGLCQYKDGKLNGRTYAWDEDLKEFRETSKGIVLRTKIGSHTWREAQYNLDTGELFLIGEQTHGFDHYTSNGNDFWWCYMNTSNRGSGLVEFLMDRNKDAVSTKSKALENGWLTYDKNIYSFIEFEPLAKQKTFVNLSAPKTPGEPDTTDAYTEDYNAIDNSKLFYVIYRNSGNGNIYSGVGGPSINQVVGSPPPGDGSSNRDNGVRADIAFKAIINLSVSDKLELLNRFPPKEKVFDDNSKPYHYVHPHGL